MRSSRLTLLAAGAFVVGLAAPAAAITDGFLDGDDHPYVGLMVIFDDEGPVARCSGTLMNPTIFLTAGHCTTVGGEEDGTPIVGTKAEIWFDSDVESGVPANGYPFDGDVSGTPYVHPDYNDNAFFLYDLGVVVLDEPVVMSAYGALPTPGVVDELATARGQKDQTITAVGYGLQAATANPLPKQIERKQQADKVRYQAELMLVNTNGTAGVPAGTSFTTSGGTNTGGTCFGDSGGPNFLGDSNVVAGVTSFGLNLNCGGIGGVYRVDAADDLAWLATFGLK